MDNENQVQAEVAAENTGAEVAASEEVAAENTGAGEAAPENEGAAQ